MRSHPRVEPVGPRGGDELPHPLLRGLDPVFGDLHARRGDLAAGVRGHGDDRVLTGHEERAVSIHGHHDGNVARDDDLLRAVLVLERELVAVVRLHHRGDHGVGHGRAGLQVPGTVTFVGNRAVLGKQVQLTRDDLAVRALHRAGSERRSGCDVGELQRLHIRKSGVRRELDLEILALARFDRQHVPVYGRDGAADPSWGLRVGGGARQSQCRENQCNANLIHRRCSPDGQAHSPRIPVSLTTRDQVKLSAWITAANSSGEPPTTSAPCTASLSPISAALTIFVTSAASRATIPRDVPAGASRPYHGLSSYPGTPASSTVDTPGSSGERRLPVTARTRSLPDLTCGSTVGMPRKAICTCPPIRSAIAGAVPL